jgi:hypothetical protein
MDITKRGDRGEREGGFPNNFSVQHPLFPKELVGFS